MKNLKIILLLAIFTTSLNVLATNRAFLVGISDYSYDPKWNNIHGGEDIDLLLPKLKKCGFLNSDIKILKDSRATYSSIIEGLRCLVRNSQRGDVVYVHFSMHGQPYEDFNGDEPDGWDESLVPYDARFSYEGSYKGQNHLIDDTLSVYVKQIREKIGPKGFVCIMLDACHAGSMNRGDGDNIRGTNAGFSPTGKLYNYKDAMVRNKRDSSMIISKPDLGSILIISACKAHQVNREIQIENSWFGRLSHFAAEAMGKFNKFWESNNAINKFTNYIKTGFEEARNQDLDIRSNLEVKN